MRREDLGSIAEGSAGCCEGCCGPTLGGCRECLGGFPPVLERYVTSLSDRRFVIARAKGGGQRGVGRCLEDDSISAHGGVVQQSRGSAHFRGDGLALGLLL